MIALAVAAVFLSINYKMYFILVGSAAFTVLSVIFFRNNGKAKKNTASFYLKVRTSGLSEEAVSIGDSTYKSGKIKRRRHYGSFANRRRRGYFQRNRRYDRRFTAEIKRKRVKYIITIQNAKIEMHPKSQRRLEVHF